MVFELIDPQTISWKEDMIRTMFPNQEIENILAIENGVCLVKMDYHLEL